MNARRILQDHFAALAASARRFPLALAFGAAGALFASIDVLRLDQYAEWNRPVSWFNAAHRACWLGIPLAFALALWAEAKGFGRRGKIGGGLAASLVVVLACVYFQGESRQVFGLRYALWMTAAVAAAMSAPLFARLGPERYRRFNTVLLQRVLTAYALVIPLAGGLCLALWAVENLFDVPIASDTYLVIWFCIAGVFGTAYFTGTAPRLRDDARENPAFLHGLTRFILLPLSVTYLVILYAYLIRLAGVRAWPEGTLSSLILAFAALGVVTHLLLQDRDGDGAVERGFRKGFYPLLAPLTAMLLAAVWRRVAEYGWTEPRVLGAVAGLWLAAAAAYFTLYRGARAAAIPVSVGAVALLISAGPWSLFNVSLRSQSGHLRENLEAAGRLRDGKLVRSGEWVSKDAEYRAADILRYLERRGALETLRPLFARDTAGCPDCLVLAGPVPSADTLGARLNIEMNAYAHGPKIVPEKKLIASDDGTDVRGYALLLPFELSLAGDDAAGRLRGVERDKGWWLAGSMGDTVHIMQWRDTVATLRLEPLVETLRRARVERRGQEVGVPRAAMRLETSSPEGRFAVQVGHLTLARPEEDAERVIYVRGELLVAPAR